MFDYGQQALEEITGAGHVKTRRQRTALAHLARWARAYAEQPHGSHQPFAEPERRREPWLRIVAGVLAVLIVVLLLVLLYGSVNR